MPALDALCPTEHIIVNKTAIKLLGLETAIYWSELMTVLKQVKLKGTVKNGFFKLDRKYMERETGIPRDRQYICDSILVESGIMLISESDPDHLAVNLPNYAALIMDGEYDAVMENSTKIREKAEKAAAPKKTRKVLTEEEKEAKRRGMIASLCNFVTEPDIDLHEAYCKWISTLVGNSRINSTTVTTFVTTIQKSGLPKAAQLFTIERATANCWVEASWVINIARQEMAKNPAAFADPVNTTRVDKTGQGF